MFVLDIGKKQTARQISELFNAHFGGVATMSEEQAKYVRHRYKNDPRYWYVIISTLCRVIPALYIMSLTLSIVAPRRQLKTVQPVPALKELLSYLLSRLSVRTFSHTRIPPRIRRFNTSVTRNSREEP